MAKIASTQPPSFQVRRVITGHDEDGRSCVVSDGDCDARISMWHPDFIITDVWHIDALPVSNVGAPDPCKKFQLEPARGGVIVRIVRFPPDGVYSGQQDDAEGTVSGSGSSGIAQEVAHSVMHRTDTVDCVIILSGEIHAVLEQGETILRAGDVLIQRGTIHGWSNRSSDPCVMAAILSSAIPGSAVPTG